MADYTGTLLSQDPISGTDAPVGVIYGQIPEGDTTDPVVDSFTPGSGSTIAPTDSITVRVSDDDQFHSLAGVLIFVQYPTLNRIELVYDGGAFQGKYSGSKTVVSAPPGEILDFQFTRTGGWTSHPVYVFVIVEDTAGNKVADYAAYTVDPDPTPADPDTTVPVVSNFDPASGTALASGDPVTFDVTDDSGSFARIFTVAWFKETGVQEVIHDGDAFVGYYAATSSRVPITNGFRYTVLRSGGWQYAPTFRVFPIDSSGNE